MSRLGPLVRRVSPGRPSKRVFLIAFLFVATLGTLWAMSSPVFSVPDESAHAVKAIAQVRGEVIGHERVGSRQLVMDVPDGYSYTPNILCFATVPERPANCGSELGDPSGTTWAETQVSAYNPLYYYVVGWPSLLFQGNAGIYAMRIASALFSAIFVAWAVQIGFASTRSRWLPAGLAFTVTPMIVYLAGSVNPNGIEVASAASFWIGLLALFDRYGAPAAEPRSRLWYPWIVVVISGVVLANARALGPLWVLIVVLLVAAVAGRKQVAALFRRGFSYWGIAVLAAGGLFSIIWTLSGGSLSGQAQKSDAPLVGASFLSGAAYMVRMTPQFLQQAIGVFGWQDTYLPGTVYWLMIAAFVAIVITAVAGLSRRNCLLLVLVSVAAFVVPLLVQAYSAHQTGIIWQGRYGLFLYIGIPIVAAWLMSGSDALRFEYLRARLVPITLGLLWVFGVAAFVFVLRRYVVGTDMPIRAMLTTPAWEPPFGWATLVALFAVVSAGAAVCLWRMSVVVARAEDLRSLMADSEPREGPVEVR